MCSFSLSNDERNYCHYHCSSLSSLPWEKAVHSSLVLSFSYYYWCSYSWSCWSSDVKERRNRFRCDPYICTRSSSSSPLLMLYRFTIYLWRENSFRLLSWPTINCRSWRILGMSLLCYSPTYFLTCIMRWSPLSRRLSWRYKSGNPKFQRLPKFNCNVCWNHILNWMLQCNRSCSY